jgi:hypothetical protein
VPGPRGSILKIRRPASEPQLPRNCTNYHEEVRCLGRQDMRVKLCARCPYTPRDLAHHYDPDAVLYACAKCDVELRETERRRKCSTSLSTSSTAQASVAPFATGRLASSVTIPGETLSVQRSALIISRSASRPTADGCGDCEQPDDGRGKNDARLSWRAASRDKESIY